MNEIPSLQFDIKECPESLDSKQSLKAYTELVNDILSSRFKDLNDKDFDESHYFEVP